MGRGIRYYDYSVDGLLNYSTDRTGNQIATTYNVGSQPVQETWSATNGNTGKTRTYEYDSLSRLKKISDGANDQVAWTFNTAGLVTNETTTIPAVGGASGNIVSSLNYSYDAFGRNTGKQLAVGGAIHYTDAMAYDLRDRLTRLTRTGSGNTSENMWTTIQYDAMDAIVGTQRAGASPGSNSGGLRRGQTRGSGFKPGIPSSDVTVEATFRFDINRRLPRLSKSEARSG